MPRTITTVTNDIIRLMGQFDRFSAEWKIQLTEPEDRWERFVTVSLSCYFREDDPKLSVAVHAFAFLKGESDTNRSVSHTTLNGTAPAARLTRKWVDHVLRREIESARIVALCSTEADLRLGGRDPLAEEAMNEYRQQIAYFTSSLEEEASSAHQKRG